MANQRAGIPAGWTWRDGRPRWKASPTLRRSGWRDRDLKNADGAWLARGASIDIAEAIMAAVTQWRGGELIASEFADIAPPGAAGEDAGYRVRPPDANSIGALIEAYTGVKKDAKKPPSPEFAGLSPTTQKDYRGKLKRMVDVLAGYADLPEKGDKAAQDAYEASVATARSLSVFTLAPEIADDGQIISDPLYEVYHALKRRGLHQASGVMAVTGAWLSWVRERRNRKVANWAAEVKRETPPGRIRIVTWEELTALVQAADDMGVFSIGDSIILGVDLSWSQSDRLQLPWSRLVDNRAYTGEEGRKKTGRVGGTPLLDGLGIPRVAQIRARQKAMAAHPTHVIWSEITKAPWRPDTYRHYFAAVREKAAEIVPSVATMSDQDLRDTAITVARRAGLSLDEICSRSLQSRRYVVDLLDRHYGEIGNEIADAGRDRLNRYISGLDLAI